MAMTPAIVIRGGTLIDASGRPGEIGDIVRFATGASPRSAAPLSLSNRVPGRTPSVSGIRRLTKFRRYTEANSGC